MSNANPAVTAEDLPPLNSAATQDVAGRTSTGALLALTLAGIIGGIASAPFVQRFEKQFPMANLTPEQTNLIRANPDDPVAWAIERQNRWDALFRNSALCLAVFGGLLGACLGLTEGVLLRSAGKVVVLAMVLALCGALSGVLAGLADAAIGLKMQDNRDQDPLPYAIGMHTASFVVVGLCIAAGLGMTTRRWSVVWRAAAGGLVAGILCAPLASFVFPLNRTDLPIPEGLGPKLMFYALAGGLIGMCVSRSARKTANAAPAA